MTRGFLLRCALILAGFGLFASPAQAQGVRVFAMGSGSFLLGEDLFALDGDAWRSNYANGGKVTLGGELTMNSVVGVEAAYAYGRNNLRITDLEDNEEAGYGVRLQRFSTNLMIHSPVKFLSVQPYVTGGLELTRFSPTSEARTRAFTEGFAGDPALLESSNKFGFNAGGGVEWYVLPAFAVRLDLRNHMTGTPRFGQSESRFPVTGRTNNLELSAGFTIHIGD